MEVKHSAGGVSPSLRHLLLGVSGGSFETSPFHFPQTCSSPLPHTLTLHRYTHLAHRASRPEYFLFRDKAS